MYIAINVSKGRKQTTVTVNPIPVLEPSRRPHLPMIIFIHEAALSLTFSLSWVKWIGTQRRQT